ncbi:Leucine-rich repeat transmembrane protein kinase [Rhynchospora pubera]|uniref:Leucine-rich repeat transmembrane protein kinase n=1 Tax=Rhynchospora pubera TaxID=906938 RepID=A0AAV8FGN6_9POAL|nr:Leucine-rich repeat transmembrane protein kinase [Rhynchospora pubera]
MTNYYLPQFQLGFLNVTALNTILARWGTKAPTSTWNTTGDPCSGWAIDDSKDLDNNGQFNPGIKCDCTYNSSQTCHIVRLKVDQNYLTGPVPAFIGNLTQLRVLSFGINALSGPIPRELGNLQNLTILAMSTNNFSGSIPEEFGNMTSLQQWYMDSSGFSGELPETLSKLTNMLIL